MNTINKIRAEIERQSKSIENAMGDFAEGRRLEQRVILAFLDTLSEDDALPCWKEVHTYTEELREGDMEKMLLDLSVGKGKRETKIALPDKVVDYLEESVSENLEEAAKQFVGYDMDRDDLRDYEIGIAAFKAGAEWQREQKDPTLDDIAEKYAEKMDISKGWFDGSEIDELIKESYKAGAEWQAEKCDEETSKLLYAERQTAYINGWHDCKEQMLKDAVEGEVENGSFGIVYLRKNLTNDGYLTGDKVKIIIVKEDKK